MRAALEVQRTRRAWGWRGWGRWGRWRTRAVVGGVVLGVHWGECLVARAGLDAGGLGAGAPAWCRGFPGFVELHNICCGPTIIVGGFRPCWTKHSVRSSICIPHAACEPPGQWQAVTQGQGQGPGGRCWRGAGGRWAQRSEAADMDVFPDAEVLELHTGGGLGAAAGISAGGQGLGGHSERSQAGRELLCARVEQLEQELQELRDKYNRLQQFLSIYSAMDSFEDQGESGQCVISVPGFSSDDE
mmetsp:Transcript_18031/g.45403  ORF Transcript_18031/g.45403 Transcript_18031/m.45403 type:complete len:244 (-) Transcript_18031:543-1274(-)